jgi:hypothetical protein
MGSYMEPEKQSHDLDDDSVCRRCGFDGAEWWHLERMKPKDEREPQPPCRPSH